MLRIHNFDQQEEDNNHCKKCNYTYSSKRGYNKHLRIVHKLKFKLVDGKRVPCSAAGEDLEIGIYEVLLL
jgi:hypothetical protein